MVDIFVRKLLAAGEEIIGSVNIRPGGKRCY